jgi:hypothetical protein
LGAPSIADLRTLRVLRAPLAVSGRGAQKSDFTAALPAIGSGVCARVDLGSASPDSLDIAIMPLIALAISATNVEAVIVLPWETDSVARPAAQHLRAQLDVGTRVLTTTLASDLQALLKAARSSWSEPYAIVLDTPRARISILRPADGTVLSRAIDTTIAEAPYAVALTASELFDLARSNVRGRAVVDEGVETHEAPGLDGSLAIDAALALSASPGHEVSLVQPMIGAAFVLRGSGSRWWASLGLRTRMFGARETRAADLSIRYDRIDASLRLLFARDQGAFDVALAIEAGGSQTRVLAKDDTGLVLAEDDRLVPWGGAGIEAHIGIAGGLSFTSAAGLLFVPRPTRYHVRNEVYSEGSIRLVVSAGLVFELG